MNVPRRLVIAVGGNALIVRHQAPDAAPQLANVGHAAQAIASVIAGNTVVVTHGNGPQVGMLSLESSTDPMLARPYPLDALVAETQGLIGYWLAQSLQNECPARVVASVVTRAVVSRDDPAFATPTKFIGAVYTESEAASLTSARGWSFGRDGAGWRRVVASPEPVEVVELPFISRLADSGAVVVCGGGGGVPVARDPDGRMVGIEAVIDKDLTSALIAESIGADALLLLTDVDAVVTHFGRADASPIARATPAEMRRRSFATGSMGPKVEAACRFVERTGAMAAIGSLAKVEAILAGTSGTLITPDGRYSRRPS